MKAQSQMKKRRIYAIDLATLDDVYGFKYELSGALDEVIDSIKGLKSIIDVWMPLEPIDYPTKDMVDEQDFDPLLF